MSETTNWTTSPLTEDRIDQAYPLLHASDPSLTLGAWRAMALAHLAHPADHSGIVTLRRGGYIHGLFCYHVEETPGVGRRLRVDVVRVLDIVDQRNADRLMRAAIGEIAHRTRCTVLDTPLAAPGPSNGGDDSDPPDSDPEPEGPTELGAAVRLPAFIAYEALCPSDPPAPAPQRPASRKRRRNGKSVVPSGRDG